MLCRRALKPTSQNIIEVIRVVTDQQPMGGTGMDNIVKDANQICAYAQNIIHVILAHQDIP